MLPSLETMVERLFFSLTPEQRKLLGTLSNLSRREQAMLGPDLICRAETCASAEAAILKACTGLKRQRVDEPPCTELANGTGPAFESIGERAVQHHYITKSALNAIRKRIKCLPESEQEQALICAMRRFCACMQPMSSIVLSGHALQGYPARLIGCAPPGGNPEVYNVAVMIANNVEPMLVRVEPKHFRPAPIERDERDDMHEVIPEDHEAEAWFAERVLVSEMMFRAEKSMGASFGPGRPC